MQMRTGRDDRLENETGQFENRTETDIGLLQGSCMDA